MFPKSLTKERASVLAEALILVVVLSTMAAFILKWTLSRHAYVAQTKRYVSGKGLVEACAAIKSAKWQNSLPAIGNTDSCNIDGHIVNVNVIAGSSSYVRKVVYTVDTSDLVN